MLPRSFTTLRTACLLAMSLALTAQEARDPVLEPVQETPGLPRVLLIGDSISMGYTLLVRDLLAGRANVQRIPENGAHTNNGVRKVEEWLGTGKWDVIHFNFGLHDLRLMDDGNNQVPLSQYEANLRRIAAKLGATGAHVIFASTTPVPGASVTPNRRNADVIAYNQAASRVMREFDIPTDDLYSLVVERLAELQVPANVHFKEEGSQVLAKQVAETIAAALPGRSQTVTRIAAPPSDPH